MISLLQDHFGGAKRNKNERVENKREHPEGDTRKVRCSLIFDLWS